MFWLNCGSEGRHDLERLLFVVGAAHLGRPRFPICIHILENPQGRPLDLPPGFGCLSSNAVGAGPRPARGSRLLRTFFKMRRGDPCGRPPMLSPTRGKAGFRERRPTANSAPGTLVRQTQAQKLNRSSGKFYNLRAPVGPDGNTPKHSWFCAPGGPCPLKGIPPVNGGLGEFNMANEVCPCKFPQRLLVPFPRGKGTRPTGRNFPQ